MSTSRHNLAIETSSRHGAVALGQADRLIDTAELSRSRGHRVDLMPTIDALLSSHGLGPGDLGEVYVSIGPGSFTGLRMAVATVKMLAATLAVRIVAVPSVDVLAAGVTDTTHPHLLACVAMKRRSAYARLYRREGERWTPDGEAAVRSFDDLLAASPRPLAVVGDPLIDLAEEADEKVTVLGPAAAVPQAQVVWRLGRQLAQAGRFTSPHHLAPLYSRIPEAQAQWDRRYGKGKGPA